MDYRYYVSLPSHTQEPLHILGAVYTIYRLYYTLYCIILDQNKAFRLHGIPYGATLNTVFLAVKWLLNTIQITF